MNASDDLERRIADLYAAEVPHRAPDRVLRAALVAVDTTRQRRVLVPAPWRFSTMQGLTRVAVVAVAVIAIGAFGLAILRPASGPAGGTAPSASPTVTPTPTATPTASPTPDPSLPPPLGGSFTSTLNGISLSYPTGWLATPATRPWTPADGLSYGSPTLDLIHHPVYDDHLFLAIASQLLGGKTGDAWVADLITDPENGCGTEPSEPITVDGSSGRICSASDLALVTAGDRGYTIRLYSSGDDPGLDAQYDVTWFRTVLDTVRLHPELADRSAQPSTRASATPKPS